MDHAPQPAFLTKHWQTHSVAETQALGRAIGAAAQPGVILALNGDLGAGKTALTQGIAAGLGITAAVTSPTFIVVNEYATPRGATLIHIDSYRLGDQPDHATLEAFTFGFEEILDREDAIVVIEWAERLRDLLPPDHLTLAFSTSPHEPETRQLTATAHGPVSDALLNAIQF
jgi:tRNA threonylcarbamoyladenosine biosynthesis protein TsaE